MESNGRMGFETGKDGIRRGGTVGAGLVASEDMLQANGLPGGREIEPDDLARRVGILENMGSASSLMSTFEPLPSDDCEPSSEDDEETTAERVPYDDIAQLGSACDDVGVLGESPDDDKESELDLNIQLEVVSVLRDDGRVDEEAVPSRAGEHMIQKAVQVDRVGNTSDVVRMETYSWSPCSGGVEGGQVMIYRPG